MCIHVRTLCTCTYTCTHNTMQEKENIVIPGKCDINENHTNNYTTIRYRLLSQCKNTIICMSLTCTNYTYLYVYTYMYMYNGLTSHTASKALSSYIKARMIRMSFSCGTTSIFPINSIVYK